MPDLMRAVNGEFPALDRANTFHVSAQLAKCPESGKENWFSFSLKTKHEQALQVKVAGCLSDELAS